MSLDTGESTVSGPSGETAPFKPFRLQFNLRHLLVLMGVLAIDFAVLFASPNALASVELGVASILLLAGLISCLVYARGYVRAFCIGAMIPTTLVAITVGCLFVVLTFEAENDSYQRIGEILNRMASGLRFATTTGWLLAIAAGALSVIIRRHFARGQTGG